MKRTIDWFLPAMGVAVLLAFLFPEPGARGGWLYPELLTKAGVALIFFLHGAALSFAALKAGAFQWRLHLIVQLATFLLFPLLGLVWIGAMGDWLSPDLKLGFFFLCATPSTVSSSVALTAAAKGNVPAAVFNATLSSLLGIVLTPFWMSWYAGTTGGNSSFGEVILNLVIWLLLPLLVGQLSRPLIAKWIARHKKRITVVDRLTILMLVYTSFCDSVVMGIWNGHGSAVIWAFVGSMVIFWAIFGIVSLICRAMRFTFEDQIAAVFCGSKKSLATGVPMAQLMFAGNPGIGLILLPIMVFHPLQLIICGILAGRWGKREGAVKHA
jgi:sodium/bile acid cotransporter 7